MRGLAVWLFLSVALASVTDAAPEKTAAEKTAAEKTSYRRACSFSSVRMSLAELQAIIEHLQSLAKTANASVSVPYRVVNESLRLGDDASSLRAPAPFDWEHLPRLPPKTYSVDYTYSYIDSPISRIELKLGDHRRMLDVEGTDVEQVDSLIASTTPLVEEHTSMLGGTLFRITGWFVLYALGVALLSLALVIIKKGRAHATLYFTGLALILIPNPVIPFEHIFAGTAILNGASWLDRNSALFTFLGFLIAIPALVLGLIPLRKRKSAPSPQPTEPQ